MHERSDRDPRDRRDGGRNSRRRGTIEPGAVSRDWKQARTAPYTVVGSAAEKDIQRMGREADALTLHADLLVRQEAFDEAQLLIDKPLAIDAGHVGARLAGAAAVCCKAMPPVPWRSSTGSAPP